MLHHAEPGDHGRMILNMGPSHPAMHGTIRIIVDIEGEAIKDADVEIGYLHRAFEKMAENRTWTQVFPYTDRMNYVSPLLNNVGFALAVEKLLGMDVPERCKYLRVVAGEMSRITDHLTCIAAQAMELGAFTVYFYMMQAREKLYDLVEELAGARLTTSWARVGGAAGDLPDGFTEKTPKALDTVMFYLDDTDKLLTKNRIFVDRMKDISPISPEEALDWGFTGPLLRATGVGYDVRKAHPYLVYDRMDFDIPVGLRGDCYDRYLVRMEEIRQSRKIVLQALKQMPKGRISVDDPRITMPEKSAVYDTIEGTISNFKLIIEGIQVPRGEVYSFTEAGNGELGFYIVSDGGGLPYRCRVRPPAFMLMQALARLIKGHMVADVIPIFGSINMIGGEVDR